MTPDLMAASTVYGPNIVKPETASAYRPWLTTLDDVLARAWGRNKGIKLNLNMNGMLLDHVLNRVDTYCFPEENLWFSSQIDVQGADGFRHLARTYPQATIECAIDYIVPLIN